MILLVVNPFCFANLPPLVRSNTAVVLEARNWTRFWCKPHSFLSPCGPVTAVFATCGMGITTFSITAILSMSKRFIAVYLGALLAVSSTGRIDLPVSMRSLNFPVLNIHRLKSNIIGDAVVGVTRLVTLTAMWCQLSETSRHS